MANTATTGIAPNSRRLSARRRPHGFSESRLPCWVKRGTIGKLKLVELDEVNDGQWDKLRLESLEEELIQVLEDNNERSDCFLEIDRHGCKVVQLGDLE